jgi:hypothetical protein
MVKGWPECGGVNGSILFDSEMYFKGNAGLSKAAALLAPVKKRYPQVSWADLIQMAGVLAIEITGGPIIRIPYGRCDVEDTSTEYTPMASENLPQAQAPFPDGAPTAAVHIRNVFYRLGFNDQEAVALCGAHTLGRAFNDRTGVCPFFSGDQGATEYTARGGAEGLCDTNSKAGMYMAGGCSWTRDWLTFSNSYFKRHFDDAMAASNNAAIASDEKESDGISKGSTATENGIGKQEKRADIIESPAAAAAAAQPSPQKVSLLSQELTLPLSSTHEQECELTTQQKKPSRLSTSTLRVSFHDSVLLGNGSSGRRSAPVLERSESSDTVTEAAMEKAFVHLAVDVNGDHESFTRRSSGTMHSYVRGFVESDEDSLGDNTASDSDHDDSGNGSGLGTLESPIFSNLRENAIAQNKMRRHDAYRSGHQRTSEKSLSLEDDFGRYRDKRISVLESNVSAASGISVSESEILSSLTSPKMPRGDRMKESRHITLRRKSSDEDPVGFKPDDRLDVPCSLDRKLFDASARNQTSNTNRRQRKSHSISLDTGSLFSPHSSMRANGSNIRDYSASQEAEAEVYSPFFSPEPKRNIGSRGQSIQVRLSAQVADNAFTTSIVDSFLARESNEEATNEESNEPDGTSTPGVDVDGPHCEDTGRSSSPDDAVHFLFKEVEESRGSLASLPIMHEKGETKKNFSTKKPKRKIDKDELLWLDMDQGLHDDPILGNWCRVYAEDESKFFRHYARAHAKMACLGTKFGSYGKFYI